VTTAKEGIAKMAKTTRKAYNNDFIVQNYEKTFVLRSIFRNFVGEIE
jgi:hypothetical protein